LSYQVVRSDEMSDNQVTMGIKRTRSKALEQSVVADALNVTLANVPSYLQKGELYHQLKQNESTDAGAENDVFLVPTKCFKQVDSVRNDRELLWLLQSLRYWVVDEVPDSVYDYLTNQLTPGEALRDIANSFPVVKVMLSLKDYPEHEHVAVAARHGEVRLMAHLRSRGRQWQHTECCEAASAGHLECLQYAFEQGCELSSHIYGWTLESSCLQAFRHGHVECLQYAQEHGCGPISYLQSRDCEHTSTACLSYILHSSRSSLGLLPSALRIIGHAATRFGSISCVNEARALGWNIGHDANLFATALLADDPVILEYVIKEGCHLDLTAAHASLTRGRTDSLIPLLDRGQHLCTASLRKLVRMGDFALLREVVDRGCCDTTAQATVAIANSLQVDILLRAFQQGFVGSVEVCVVAAAAGNLAVLQCAVQSGCSTSPRVCTADAKGGHLTCLQYAHESGGALTLEAAKEAARGGHLACLRYLHEPGSAEFGTAVQLAAINSDAVSCVRYLHERRCGFDSSYGARRSAQAGSLACLRFYHEQAGPQRARMRGWDAVWKAARRSKNGAVREYALQNG
jgi:hypothetical protein